MNEIRGGGETWIKHYSSAHEILLVGEGDFSFSLCLGMTFGSATNIVATSLDSYDELINKYKNAMANLGILRALGATLLHGVDATQMKTLPHLQWKKFHRIIFNFPHAGFHGKEDNPQMIMMHRNLVRGFLWDASSMLRPNGEIHINHKTTAPFNLWRIEDLASECSLLCIGQDEFRIEHYPWYHNKRGSAPRSDKPFPLGACSTFKFQLYPKMTRELHFMPSTPQPQMFATSDECRRIFGEYLNHVEETFGSTNYDVRRSVEKALQLGFETYLSGAPLRPLSGFIGVLEELHHLSVLRSRRLRVMQQQLLDQQR